MANIKRTSTVGIILMLSLPLIWLMGCSHAYVDYGRLSGQDGPQESAQPEAQANNDLLGSIPFPAAVPREGSGIAIETVAGSDYETGEPSLNADRSKFP